MQSIVESLSRSVIQSDLLPQDSATCRYCDRHAPRPSPGRLWLRLARALLEVTRLDNDQLREPEVLPERGVDDGGRQCGDPLLLLGVKGQRPADVQRVGELQRQFRIGRTPG